MWIIVAQTIDGGKRFMFHNRLDNRSAKIISAGDNSAVSQIRGMKICGVVIVGSPYTRNLCREIFPYLEHVKKSRGIAFSDYRAEGPVQPLREIVLDYKMYDYNFPAPSRRIDPNTRKKRR